MERGVAVEVLAACGRGSMSITGKHHGKLVSTGQVLQQVPCTIASARSPAFLALLEIGQKMVFYSKQSHKFVLLQKAVPA